MSFKSFLKKYAAEMSVVGTALDAVANVTTADKGDIETIRDAGQVAKSAAKNILETIDDISDLTIGKLTKDDLRDIVAEMLPFALSTALDLATRAKVKKEAPKSGDTIVKAK